MILKTQWDEGTDWVEEQWDEGTDYVEEHISQPINNTVLNGNWWHNQWDGWLETTLCVIGIAALIAIGVLLGSPVIVICTVIGTILGGTKMHPFSKEAWSNWDWGYALLGAGIGFAVGCIGQYAWGTGNPLDWPGYAKYLSNILYSLGVGTGNYGWYYFAFGLTGIITLGQTSWGNGSQGRSGANILYNILNTTIPQSLNSENSYRNSDDQIMNLINSLSLTPI